MTRQSPNSERTKSVFLRTVLYCFLTKLLVNRLRSQSVVFLSRRVMRVACLRPLGGLGAARHAASGRGAGESLRAAEVLRRVAAAYRTRPVRLQTDRHTLQYKFRYLITSYDCFNTAVDNFVRYLKRKKNSFNSTGSYQDQKK